MTAQLEMFQTGATPFAVTVAKREQRMHVNSVRTYRETREHLDNRETEVLAVYIKHGAPLTDREVLKLMGGKEMNDCRPRITSLRDKGVIREVGKVVDEYTGRAVRVCEVVK